MAGSAGLDTRRKLFAKEPVVEAVQCAGWVRPVALVCNPAHHPVRSVESLVGVRARVAVAARVVVAQDTVVIGRR